MTYKGRFVMIDFLNFQILGDLGPRIMHILLLAFIWITLPIDEIKKNRGIQ